MKETIINPFKQAKKTDWAKKAQDRLVKAKEKKEKIKPIKKNSKIKRVAKSFKVYPGNLTRDFDKRINKMQVTFDDLDYDKDYVDSGKYLMFIMAFAEKYRLYELYTQVDENGNFELDKKTIINHFGKVLK
jgi:arginyl-tRNA synthetase